MKIERLVKMANQIGTFFEAEAAPDLAANDVAGHLKRFWDPRMRRQIIEHVEQQDGEGLMPLVKLGIQRNKAALMGSSQPIREEQRWVGEAGASDAG
jgi:formate dehydrogenase subunit delta